MNAIRTRIGIGVATLALAGGAAGGIAALGGDGGSGDGNSASGTRDRTTTADGAKAARDNGHGTDSVDVKIGTQRATAKSVSVKCRYNGSRPARAGFYSGSRVVPSSTHRTAAGAEAQCLLDSLEYLPSGEVDGIFGPRSKKAMKKFQQSVNKNLCGRKVLATDGLPGPKSWPFLRGAGRC